MSVQHRPPSAIAADGPDYLDLAVRWTPSQRFGHGQVNEYRLAFGNDVAILQLVPGKGWAMTIAHGTSQPDTERGLFATPHDALMVLHAEFGFTKHDAGTQGGAAVDSPREEIASESHHSKVGSPVSAEA